MDKIIIGFFKSIILLLKVITPTCIGLTAALFGARYIGLVSITWKEVFAPLVIYAVVTIIIVCITEIIQKLSDE